MGFNGDKLENDGNASLFNLLMAVAFYPLQLQLPPLPRRLIRRRPKMQGDHLYPRPPLGSVMFGPQPLHVVLTPKSPRCDIWEPERI